VSQLRICAPFRPMSGYAKMGRAVLRTALVAGYDVQAVESDLRVDLEGWHDGRVTERFFVPPPFIRLPDDQDAELHAAERNVIAPDAPTLLIQLPGCLSNWRQYANGPMLGWTMTESDNLCPYWQHGIRNVDLVLAPSEYVLETFRRVVPETPSMLLPLPVDDRQWSPEEFREKIPRIDPRPVPKFLFLSVFQTSQRKMWRELMTAFAEEFCDDPDVGLIVKPTSGDEVWPLRDHCREMGAWIHVDVEKRTDWMLGALYRACNVYVQPCSEGFGLTFVEAAMCGLPSVTIDGGGARDVVSEDTGYMVPSFMGPIVGHMPQVYDRKRDRFAVFEIDDLRAAMRRAYEDEKAGVDKGLTARTRALQRFTPEAIAPKLQEAVEMCVDLHSGQVSMTVPPLKPSWATVAGAWGDVFCCVGKIRAMMADKEMESIGVIFYGKDPKIADWLRAQPWCREVLAIIEPDKKEMERVFARLCQCRPEHGRQMFYELLESKRGVVVTSEIAFTQLCLAREEEPQYWTGAVLPKEAHEWAESVKPSGDFLLLNPLSLASNKLGDHWPHWWREDGAIFWLLGASRVPVVMVAEQEIPWPEHPRLVNLTGQSRSMMDVLALAEKSSGVITTGNNLGIYAPIGGIPAVVVMARTAPRGGFYHRWYDGWCTQVVDDEQVRSLVEFNEPLSDFKDAVMARFPQFVNEMPDLLTEATYYQSNYGTGGP